MQFNQLKRYSASHPAASNGSFREYKAYVSIIGNESGFGISFLQVLKNDFGSLIIDVDADMNGNLFVLADSIFTEYKTVATIAPQTPFYNFIPIGYRADIDNVVFCGFANAALEVEFPYYIHIQVFN